MAFISILTSCEKEKMTKAAYEGKDISSEAAITRDKQTKAATLEIELEGKWELYAGKTVDNINFSKPVLEGDKSGKYPIAVDDSTRSYFQLVTTEGKAILAEKHLPMTGGYNFRDMGGICTTEGKYIKWGKILRSDDLHNLTSQDLAYLASVPLVSIVDFRTAQEMQQAPDKAPSSVKYEYPYSITPGNLNPSNFKVDASESDMMDMMKQMNIALVKDSSSLKIYKDFFRILQEEDKAPLMFHCSAGKDRTGMAAALVLYALGVDDVTILEDYLLSNVYLDDKYAEYKKEAPSMKPLFEVNAGYLQSGINYIKEEYGSVENFLKKELDVDIKKFREMYLY